jgi:hypothetical protein
LTSCSIVRRARVAKINKYNQARPHLESEVMPGWSLNNHYLPEEFHRREPSLVPPQDIALIERVMEGSPARGVRPKSPIAVATLAEIDRAWPPRSIRPDAYSARWLSLPSITDMRTNETRRVFVRVVNDGAETWPYGDQEPRFRLGYRWIGGGSSASVIGEGRATFTADVAPGATVLQPMTLCSPREPGEYGLEFSLVHEGFRWFGDRPSFVVRVGTA